MVAVCRLFGLSGGPERIRATFWLLEAPDSLAAQSRREPDGTGLGTFDADGTPCVDKAPIAAYEDQQFAQQARERLSRTFIAHIRYASTGGLRPENTHPFQQRGRLFAHNGVIADLPCLEAKLGDYLSLVRGQTDSERFFALITRCIDVHDGDISAGITSAARWAAANLPIYAVNLILSTPDDLFALRYPDTHDLLVLPRVAGGPHGARHLAGQRRWPNPRSLRGTGHHPSSRGRQRTHGRQSPLALTKTRRITPRRPQPHNPHQYCCPTTTHTPTDPGRSGPGRGMPKTRIR